MYCVALPWILQGGKWGKNEAKNYNDFFVIVEYAFILLEEMEDCSFSNLFGKFGVRFTCITSNINSFLQVLFFILFS